MACACTLLLALSGCGGCEGSDCRNSGDCAGSLECSGPSEPQVCGIGPNEQCGDDTSCGPDAVCHARYDVCSPDNVGSECGTPCTDGQCGPDFRCSAAGACEAIPCDEGYACGPHQACDPSIPNGNGPVFQRAHGCVAISCTGDGDCPEQTYCVNGRCQEGLGTCVEVQLIP